MKEYNGAMLQAFHWYTPADGSLWTRLAEDAAALAQAGITSLWLPPAYKGAGGPEDVGYGVYDHFDLGEFDQKGAVRTKYGTREQYLKAIKAAQDAKMRVYADIVLNHKMGGDAEEDFQATPYDPENRNKAVGERQTIRSWTNFSFPGRKGKYSELHWHWWHFNALDYNSLSPDSEAVYLIDDKRFHDAVAQDRGNFDYLMGCNLDFNNADVRKEMFHWGRWYVDTTGIDGFRFDALKHVPAHFFVDWLHHLRDHSGRDLFAFGEYWSAVGSALRHFIKTTEHHIMLFDAGLHYNFAAAGRQGKEYDLRKIFEGSLVKDHPDMAVTLVSNHDTQPLQTLESVVEPWFKPLAYALILLRRGGYPCVFAADYYGAKYKGIDRNGDTHEIVMPKHKWMIDRFLSARRDHAYGEQNDYFDEPHCVGWVRTGNEEHPGGLAVLLSNDADGSKSMCTGAPDTKYIDHTEHCSEPVVTNGEGWGDFCCKGGSVSVWVPAG